MNQITLPPTGFCPWAARFEQDFALVIETALPELTRTLEPQLAESLLRKEIRSLCKPEAQIGPTGIAVLPIHGTLAYKPNAWELMSGDVECSGAVYDALKKLCDDDKVKGVVLDINSPGGFFTGGPEVAACVRTCSKKKPVVAWTGGAMGSLAYMIGSQADNVIATESARVGSIGAMATFIDVSRLAKNLGVEVKVFRDKGSTVKGIGVPGTALGETGERVIQDTVDEMAEQFRGMVKEARPQISDESMKAQVYHGEKAFKSGLIDAIGDLDYAIELCNQLRRVR